MSPDSWSCDPYCDVRIFSQWGLRGSCDATMVKLVIAQGEACFYKVINSDNE